MSDDGRDGGDVTTLEDDDVAEPAAAATDGESLVEDAEEIDDAAEPAAAATDGESLVEDAEEIDHDPEPAAAATDGESLVEDAEEIDHDPEPAAAATDEEAIVDEADEADDIEEVAHAVHVLAAEPVEPAATDGTAPMAPARTRRQQRQEIKASARRVRRVVRRVDPWSVLKVASIFIACLWGIVVLASLVIWRAAVTSGSVDNTEDFIKDLGFEDFNFDPQQMFESLLSAGAVVAIAAIFFVVLLTVLFNLVCDITGGLRITMIEQDLADQRDATPDP